MGTAGHIAKTGALSRMSFGIRLFLDLARLFRILGCTVTNEPILRSILNTTVMSLSLAHRLTMKLGAPQQRI